MPRLPLTLALCLFTLSLFAQNRTYTYLIYHKLSPGLTVQDALPVEREWRAVNQAAVDEGNMIGWYMMAKQMTSNPNSTEYDYVTVIVTPTMNIKGGSPVAMTKLYGDSVQTRMDNLNKRDRATAPVVKMEVWENPDAYTFSPDFTPSATPVVVLNYMKPYDPKAAWADLLDPMKTWATSRLKDNSLSGWAFSRLILPNGSEKGYSLLIAQVGTTATSIANPLVINTESIKAYTQSRQTFDVVRQEVFRIMEFTTRPKTAANK
ncbi:hypothetical protein J2I47_18360 [Fibrella sp. HMF5335]|uniref:GLPGLI family protein n=1 Tax=Fibrella rubiginis TaxID=2817060 RepID=A0A939GHP6_9BACT|nr:hypothetical protein [Fibrella rubiginis]MBO0938521.1 hypothetical protein [Fibrella rubiginis]